MHTYVYVYEHMYIYLIIYELNINIEIILHINYICWYILYKLLNTYFISSWDKINWTYKTLWSTYKLSSPLSAVFGLSKYKKGAGEMVQWVKTLASKPADLSSLIRIHMLKGKNWLLQVFLWAPPMCFYMHTACRCMSIDIILK